MMLTSWHPDVSAPVDTHAPQSKYEKNTPWAVSTMQGDFEFLYLPHLSIHPIMRYFRRLPAYASARFYLGNPDELAGPASMRR
mgnify:FL=1